MSFARDDRYEAIVEAVLRIPRGRVASYGQVATAAELPGRARLVGKVLQNLPADSGVPWQRVVGASGKISLESAAADLQRELLEAEGVRFRGDRVIWAECRWREGLEEG